MGRGNNWASPALTQVAAESGDLAVAGPPVDPGAVTVMRLSRLRPKASSQTLADELAAYAVKIATAVPA